MRPGKTKRSGAGDLFRSRLDRIVTMDHELVRPARTIERERIEGELAGRCSAKPVPSLPKAAAGERANAVLTAVGHNLRLISQGSGFSRA